MAKKGWEAPTRAVHEQRINGDHSSMCLAVPGKIITVAESADPFARMARVSFGGIVKEVCLAYTPEAKTGDYVIVHVGFALNTVDEAEASRVFEYLKGMDELAELEAG
jgi:hydrogenase expression/formation protein HypC